MPIIVPIAYHYIRNAVVIVDGSAAGWMVLVSAFLFLAP